MWTHLAILATLVGVAFSRQRHPICKIQPLKPLGRYQSAAEVYHYEASPHAHNATTKVVKDGIVYKFAEPLGYVIPEQDYWENEERITSACGPMEITEIWPKMKIATIASAQSPCNIETYPLYYGLCDEQRCVKGHPFPNARIAIGNWVIQARCS